MNRENQFFVKNVKTIKTCGVEMVYFEGSSFEKPFEIKYFKEEKHNLDNCEGCQKAHKSIIEQITTYYRLFPLCCVHHQKLIHEKWFNKKDFENLPKMVADKTLFTHHHIINKLQDENWKDEITNYIEYAIASFGLIPEGYGEPVGLSNFFSFLLKLQSGLKLDQENAIYKDRHLYIINFLKGYLKPGKEIKTDMNLLLSTYDKWFKIFPFDIPLFANLKKEYAPKIILTDQPKLNPYLGTAKVKLLTQDRLFDYLMKITNKILVTIDTTQLLDDKYITDETKYQFDLKLKTHKLNQDLLLKEFAKGEKKYIKTIKKWLENEKKFLNEIQPNIINIPSKTTKEIKTFESLIKSKAKREYVMQLLEDLSITSDGQSVLTPKKKGALRGVVEALREEMIIPNLGLSKLCNIFATEINLVLKSELDASTNSEKYRKQALIYINTHPID